MGWDGMGWDGMGWDGMGWDGMGWDACSGLCSHTINKVPENVTHLDIEHTLRRALQIPDSLRMCREGE